MSNNLFSHKTSGETSSLFIDEKIANARSKIIEWLNESMNARPNIKTETIKKIQEFILRSNTDLFEEFIDNVLAFGMDPSQEVRRAVVGFIEEVCKVRIDFLPRVINVLATLLRDTSPQVTKRVIQSCAAVYKNTLIWLSKLGDISEATEQAWKTLCQMKGEIIDMIDHDNDGIRTNAIKFLEGIVILQTYPDEDSMKRDNDFSLEDIPLTLKLSRRRKLEDEAINIFESLIKFHAATHISSVNLIACMGTLCTIAKMRPTFMATVVDALKQLNINLPPTLTDSQISSVRKHLRMQLMNILKLPAAFEQQTAIGSILTDLGATAQEISRAIPKLPKHEQQRRAKRTVDNQTVTAAKKARIEKDSGGGKTSTQKRQLEVDVDEIEDQKQRSNQINETAIMESVKNIETVIDLVIASMDGLPNSIPQTFLREYTPIVNMSVKQQLQRISKSIAEMLTERRLGPGSTAISQKPPMRLKVSLEEEKNIVLGLRTEPNEVDESESMEQETEPETDKSDVTRKEEATKKLRENIERLKGEQAMQPRMKQRAKTLRLQEITKPLSRSIKEKFLLNAVKRVLNAERSSLIGGVSQKRQKFLTVFAATFASSVREDIIRFIMSDIKNRINLAFSWLYEEYCLLQGYTRHSYIKSENKPDYAYNKLLGELIIGVVNNKSIEEDKEEILRRIYLEAPLISDEAFDHLVMMCELAELCDCAMGLIKDLIIQRPTRQEKLVQMLLKYCVHNNFVIRERAIENVISLYDVAKIMLEKIDETAIIWLEYLEKPEPPLDIFGLDYERPDSSPWTEDLTKICLTIVLALLPYNAMFIHKLAKTYVIASPDTKRTILRSIEQPVKLMGTENSSLLSLIDQCPKGCETLITKIIHIMTEIQVPHQDLIQKVRDLYQTKISDVRMLIPILNYLGKQEILTALPKLLKLNPIVVKEVLNRLLGIGKVNAQKTLPLTATEIMVALHTIDITKCELKYIVKATSLCLQEKECYTHEVLAIVLQQLVEITPIPTLLMRTVIQSLTLYPRLSGFVSNLLQRLIPKQVWQHKVVWDGFMKCCQKLKPGSIPVMLSLPSQQLQDALNMCPDLRQPMIDYVNELIESQGGSFPKVTMDILLGHSLDLYITDIIGLREYPHGGFIPPDNIKKEIIELTTDGINQPLPPGEE